jgi:hypothetical protein
MHAIPAQILPFDHISFPEFLNFMSKIMQSIASPRHPGVMFSRELDAKMVARW